MAFGEHGISGGLPVHTGEGGLACSWLGDGGHGSEESPDPSDDSQGRPDLFTARTPRGCEEPAAAESGSMRRGERPQHCARRNPGRNLGRQSSIARRRRNATWSANNPARYGTKGCAKDTPELRRTECDRDNVGWRIARNY